MTFRVIAGNTHQNNTKVEGADRSKDLLIHSAEIERLPPQQLAPVGQLLDRLEALSFTFEALNAGSRTYAAEAVLETLARMERRDLQALAAIEAFASALKTVSQHLAGLRNAVHATAHETAIGLEHIGERLARLEQRTGFTASAESGTMLESIAQRLAGIEAIVAGNGPAIGEGDAGAITGALETIARRVSRIEKKVGEIPAGQPGEKFDAVPITTLLETIARRLSRLESKTEAAPSGQPAVDAQAINTALETIARRVSRIEKKMAEPAVAPTIELDATPLNDTLETIAQQVAALERKMDSGADGHSVATCLLALDHRLSRIEAGLSVDGQQAAGQAAAAPVAEPQPEAAAPAATIEPVAEAEARTNATMAPEVTTEVTTAAPPAPPKPAAEEAGGARQRVDLLLEQVFRVLSR